MSVASTSSTPVPTKQNVDINAKHDNVLDSVESAVAAIEAGDFVVVVDDMDRENEGDR